MTPHDNYGKEVNMKIEAEEFKTQRTRSKQNIIIQAKLVKVKVPLNIILNIQTADQSREHGRRQSAEENISKTPTI
jgi:hypothetical protein